MKICTVKDLAIEAYGRPIFVRHINEALRSFRDEAMDKSTALAKHPDDYELYLIGDYDENTGEITPITPTRLARGGDFDQE